MRLTRVHVDGVLQVGAELELPAEAAAHLTKVLRARSGDELILFTGDGREFLAAVERVRGPRVAVAIREVRTVDRESPLAITLLQCVPRGDRMDFIVQKATELGVTRIVPLLSRRSVVRLDAAQARSKAAHWHAVAVSACEQCGRNRLPSVATARPLIDYLAEPPDGAPRLLLDPDVEVRGALELPGGAVEIAVGPEGGFADEELEAFRLSGFTAVRLGPRVLRTETAAIAAIAWLQGRYGDLQAG